MLIYFKVKCKNTFPTKKKKHLESCRSSLEHVRNTDIITSVSEYGRRYRSFILAQFVVAHISDKSCIEIEYYSSDLSLTSKEYISLGSVYNVQTVLIRLCYFDVTNTTKIFTLIAITSIEKVHEN